MRTTMIKYMIRSLDDTLWNLAQRYGPTLNAILAANPGIIPEHLKIGDIVNIPVTGGAGPITDSSFSSPSFAPITCIPESRGSEQTWLDRHNSILDETRSNPNGIRVVFLGDSITEGWKWLGKSIWNMHYAPRGAVNYGIFGDRTQNILWRIRNGELSGLNPTLIVLKIGTNNIGCATPDDIAGGIQTIVQDIGRMLPNTRILLLGILPRGDGPVINDDIVKVNATISTFDNGHSIRFLNMSSSFQHSHAQVKPELYVDHAHLSALGYQQWYSTMELLFSNLLNY